MGLASTSLQPMARYFSMSLRITLAVSATMGPL